MSEMRTRRRRQRAEPEVETMEAAEAVEIVEGEAVEAPDEAEIATKSGIGHNNPPVPVDEEMSDEGTALAVNQLRSFIERVERLNEEKQSIADDIKEVFAEAKGTGFDVKALRALIRLRKMDQDQRLNEEGVLNLYKAALGMA